MNYNNPIKNGSTVTIRVMCAIVFAVFSFAWIYFFQSDLLAMTQHVLSGGQTTYSPMFGAILLTVSLLLFQQLVYRVAKLKKRYHALTYLPSMLLLAMLTGISLKTGGRSMIDWHWYMPVVVMVVWLLLILLARLLQEVEDDRDYSLFSRPMWFNMLLLALQMMFVAWIGNTNAVMHYRMKTEYLMSEGEYRKALDVGRQSLESDSDLLMLRMYALARENALGERLFEYPISGTSSVILPTNSRDRMVLYPVDSLYRFLGARPAHPMPPMRYLELLLARQSKDSCLQTPVSSYYLCGLLIDKDLDSFVRRLLDLCPEGDSLMIDHLPRHYREAMTLYTHLRAHPLIVYHNSVLEEDWQNLQELEALYPDATERKGRVEEQYRGTYWYYYRYE